MIYIANIMLLAIYILIVLLSPYIIQFIQYTNIELDMPSDITNIIITLSTISISMFQLIMGKLDDRILGMSYKKIFIKDTIWKYGNFPNSAIILLEIIAISCILDIFGSYTDVEILQCVIANCKSRD